MGLVVFCDAAAAARLVSGPSSPLSDAALQRAYDEHHTRLSDAEAPNHPTTSTTVYWINTSTNRPTMDHINTLSQVSNIQKPRTYIHHMI